MACPTGKVQHSSREAAEAHQKRLVWKNHVCGQDERSKGLNVYPCPLATCGAWHVGHSHGERMPLVYHYTTMDRLDDILAVDELRPRNGRRLGRAINEPNPLLWFSWNQVWEHSVIKDPRKRRRNPPTGRAITELHGEGLIRFSAPASVAKKRWNDYLLLNETPYVQREFMAQRGNPVDWLATDQPVPLDACRGLEVWYRGAWVDGADVSDEAWEAYIHEREAVYEAAWHRLAEKVLTMDVDGTDTLKLEDDAETILFDDYMVACHLDEWKQEHLDEIRKFAATLPPPPRAPQHGPGTRKRKRRR